MEAIENRIERKMLLEKAQFTNQFSANLKQRGLEIDDDIYKSILQAYERGLKDGLRAGLEIVFLID